MDRRIDGRWIGGWMDKGWMDDDTRLAPLGWPRGHC